MLYSQKKDVESKHPEEMWASIRTQAVCGLWEIITARVVSRVSYWIFCWGGGGGGGHMATHASPTPSHSLGASYHTQGCDQLTCFDMFRSGYVLDYLPHSCHRVQYM